MSTVYNTIYHWQLTHWHFVCMLHILLYRVPAFEFAMSSMAGPPLKRHRGDTEQPRLLTQEEYELTIDSPPQYHLYEWGPEELELFFRGVKQADGTFKIVPIVPTPETTTDPTAPTETQDVVVVLDDVESTFVENHQDQESNCEDQWIVTFVIQRSKSLFIRGAFLSPVLVVEDEDMIYQFPMLDLLIELRINAAQRIAWNMHSFTQDSSFQVGQKMCRLANKSVTLLRWSGWITNGIRLNWIVE